MVPEVLLDRARYTRHLQAKSPILAEHHNGCMIITVQRRLCVEEVDEIELIRGRDSSAWPSRAADVSSGDRSLRLVADIVTGL
jgi:hypothetical protein